MLFHITMTHTEDNCPAYNPEVMSQFLQAADKLDAHAQQLHVTVHSLLWGSPEHVAYAIVEADNFTAVGQFVLSMPIRQDFKVTPVTHLSDVVAMANAMRAEAK